MRFRRAACGLCKSTKRYKRRNRKRESVLKGELLKGIPTTSIRLREHHR